MEQEKKKCPGIDLKKLQSFDGEVELRANTQNQNKRCKCSGKHSPHYR